MKTELTAVEAMKSTAAHVVQKMTFDAARPYAVLTTLRSFNRVIARYADQSQAQRRARDMNKACEA